MCRASIVISSFILIFYVFWAWLLFDGIERIMTTELEKGKCYTTKPSEDPFATDQNLKIHVVDKKAGYVKYCFLELCDSGEKYMHSDESRSRVFHVEILCPGGLGE